MRQRINLGAALLAAILGLALGVLPALGAGGGADYGRGPETDPAATNLLHQYVFGRTSTWNTASSVAANGTNRVAALEAATGTWNVASTTAITATNELAGIKANTNAYARAAAGVTFTSGTFQVIGTQLVFIVSGVTNALDADITSP